MKDAAKNIKARVVTEGEQQEKFPGNRVGKVSRFRQLHG